MNTQFSTYFNNWLYGQSGYYSNYHAIGKEGDFYTAVSTSIFFGGSIGKKIVDTIEKGNLPKNTTILEVGAHHGYLLADIIQFIYTLNPKLIESLNFAIVERFKHLQEQQANYLKASFGENINLTFYDDISDVHLDSAFIVANEIYDAFACELVYTNDENILQTAVVNNHTIEFVDCEDKTLINHCKQHKITKGEVAVGYEAFAKHICEQIQTFEFITFDYGEKYPRNDFSTRIYSKHEVHPIFEENLNLETLYQNSDITYDVNFQHVMDSFSVNAYCEFEYTTQLKALIDFGIIELLEMLKSNASEAVYLKETQKVKTLLEPTGMGDRFKMLHVKKT